MALLIEDKKQIVAEVNEVASKAFSAVVADYQGMSVEQLTALRVEARKLGVLHVLYVILWQNVLFKIRNSRS